MTMDETIKKEFILEGLCCGNCAAKIERDVQKLNGVSNAAVDFVAKTLTMDIQDAKEANNLIAQTEAIIKRHDSDISMVEKEILQPGKNVLYLIGLDCAD